MLLKPDAKTLSALASIEASQEGKELIRWLRESLDHLLSDAAITRDEINVRWMQGAAQALNENLDYISRSHAILRGKH